MKAFLIRLALVLGRTPPETEVLRNARRFGSTTAIFLGLSILLVGLCVPLLLNQVVTWQRFRPAVPLPGDVWHILPVGPGTQHCPLNANLSPDCPANPANPALWNAPWRREATPADDAGGLRSPRPMEYWLGASVPAELRGRALAMGAHQLLLGWIYTPYRIYINGKFVGGGAGWEELEPIFIRFSVTKLRREKALFIAIHFYGAGGSSYAADFFNSDSGGEGFVTARGENVYRAYSAFAWRARPFALSVAYGVAALLFFFIWLPNRLRQEYFHMALFALVGCGYQALDVDLLRYQLPERTHRFLADGLLLYQAGFGLLLGLSFARAKDVVFRFGIPVILFSPIPMHMMLWSFDAPYAVQEFLQLWMLPACSLLGAAACWLEAYHLREKGRTGASLPVRRSRLEVFGVGMAALALSYVVQFHGIFPTLNRMLWLTAGLEGFVLVLFVAGIALREYGDQELLVAKTPVSPYHRRPVLPERVRGALLVIDLKNSEALFRLGASEGDAGRLVDNCLSHLWTAVAQSGGVVLQTEGDALRAFFDEDACPQPALVALRATDVMDRALHEFDARIRSQGVVTQVIPELQFRAGIALGEIRPVWHEFGGTRQADWIEAGSSNPFVESARLMDVERKVNARAPGTLVMISEEVAEACTRDLVGEGDPRAPEGVWRARALTLHGKHGVPYQVAVYCPVATARADVSSRAA